METVQFYGNHVMLILNPVQEIQHLSVRTVDPESSSG